MKLKRYISLAAFALPLVALAQSSLSISFEQENDTTYSKLGVYDSWENSPFRSNKLAGNVKVVSNHLNTVDEDLEKAPNDSKKILGFQRSRYGSNLFGARIDLKKPFALDPTMRYVHVLIHKPQSGRVMLIGLGKRTERAGQSAETEQFQVLSSTTVKENKWSDAVFAINSQTGVEIHSLVIVPDCERPDLLTEDFAVYIDSIEMNSSAVARVVYGDYPINYETTTTLSRTDRYTNTVKLTSTSDGAQTITVNQQTTKLLYSPLLTKTVYAKAGETVTPAVGFNTNWMHAYVYVDYNNDGKFNYTLNDDGTPATDGELVSYTYYSGKNSKGATTNSNPGMTMPSFTIPAGTKPGIYRMRYKVDWDCIDPAGNVTAGNLISDNGGAIIDVRLCIHGDSITLTRTNDGKDGLNGDLKLADGSAVLSTVKIPYGKGYTVMEAPENGFVLDYLRVRHGFNCSADSLVHGTPQYLEVRYPAYAFRDSLFTIPASVIDGDVQLIPVFTEKGKVVTPEGEDYPLNFDESLTISRTDRALSGFTVAVTGGATKTFTLTGSTNYVYRDMLSSIAPVATGDEVTITPTYTGRAMHLYFYLDMNQDGQFDNSLNSDGTPAYNGEMLSYLYYNGINSLGQTASTPGEGLAALPVFTVPEYLPVGVYRARLKIDWNNIDPAGQWSEAGDNKINDNGGYVVDFLLAVHSAAEKLEVLTTNGSIVGANNKGVAPTTTTGTALSLVPLPAMDDFAADKITIRHGLNLDGVQYIHGNRQWSEYTVDGGEAFTIPADSIYGALRLTADFEQQTQDVTLAFSDEFDGEDGTQPSSAKWARSERTNATWQRFVAQTDEGKKQTGYIEDGKFVALCIPNTLDDEAVNGTKQEMISAAIETQGKFDFKYGKIEGRLRTDPYTGNFPAFWMIPTDQSAGWPYYGEIDIWEQIDAQNISHHTVHSKWANTTADGAECQGQTNNPAKTASCNTTTNGIYHTFGLVWTPFLLTWYVDGKQVHSYAKSTVQSDLDLGQWPFDKAFYIILNQSVGNGSWAKSPDTTHTYTTLFDWVRVYQSDGMSSGIGATTTDAASSLDYYIQSGKVLLVAGKPTHVSIVDLAGRTLYNQTIQGNVSVSLPQGVYVLNGNKVLVP